MKQVFYSIVFSIIYSLSATAATAEKPVVILVPGFFNSLAAGYVDSQPSVMALDIQPYFSIDIIRAFRQAGLETVVVNTLAPIGSLEGNGQRLMQFFSQLQKDPRYKGRSFNILAHSAGGLYSLYALSKMPQFPVKHLVTIATPFRGVEFVDQLAHIPLLPKLMDLIELRSVPELRPGRVATFLNNLKIPASISVHAIAPVQKLNFDFTDGRNLSWPLAILSPLISEASDGIIGLSSAQGKSVVLRSALGNVLPISVIPTKVSLEHWEQVTDYRCFTLLGVRNIGVIRQAQLELYKALVIAFAK